MYTNKKDLSLLDFGLFLSNQSTTLMLIRTDC